LTAQLELEFASPAYAWTREQYWSSLGYDGPVPGRYCNIEPLIAELEAGGTIYAYMEQCRLVEKRPDGRWLAVIDMGITNRAKWCKDGTRILLSEDEIWPPMRQPIENRNDLH